MTTMGGVLISWIASRAYARDQAREEFNTQLGSLSRNLGQVAGQIGRAVNLGATSEIEASAAFAMVDQANQMVYGQVNEIAVLQGAGFDPGYLIETAQTLQAVTEQLASREPRTDASLVKVQRELARVTSTLRNSPGPRTYEQVSVQCPYCGHSNSLRLGNFPGDTAGPRCEQCKRTYFAHRAVTGAVFASRPGVPGAERTVERWRFACPECGNSLSTAGAGPPKVIACLECDAALHVTPSDQTVVAEGKFTRTPQLIAARSGNRPLLECPVCNTPRKSFLASGNRYFAICLEDRQLMETDLSDWETWQRENALEAQVPATPAPATVNGDIHD